MFLPFLNLQSGVNLDLNVIHFDLRDFLDFCKVTNKYMNFLGLFWNSEIRFRLVSTWESVTSLPYSGGPSEKGSWDLEILENHSGLRCWSRRHEGTHWDAEWGFTVQVNLNFEDLEIWETGWKGCFLLLPWWEFVSSRARALGLFLPFMGSIFWDV